MAFGRVSSALLFVLLASVSAQKIALSPNPATFNLVAGFVGTVQFRLNAPIICVNQNAECSVVVKITNGDTNAVALDTCMVKWLDSEWSQVRTITIRARPSFVDDAQRTITLTTNAAISGSLYYNNTKPADITLNTARRRSSQCVATGDPHYTTFDGYYWHFYEVAQNVVYRSTAVGRTFEIQARLWGPPYAKHCALAGREEGDMVIIDGCSGNVNVISRFSSPIDQRPRVVVSGTSYMVYFLSGAFMRADWGGWGMNVQFTAPGQDWNRTVGMCGNNNGNPNDDAAMYVVTYYRDLFPTQRMDGRQDLWTWYPPINPTLTAASAPYSQECPTQDTPIIPILNNPGGIDITNNLKNDVNTTGTGATTTAAPFVINTLPPTVAPVMISRADATARCNTTIMNSTLAKTCAPLFALNNDTTWATRYISGCADDIVLIGYDPAWIASAMQGLQNECALLSAQFNASLSTVFCPTTNTQPCSGHGTCNNNQCVCSGTYAGVDCSIDSSKPPVLNILGASTCDVLGIQSCPTSTVRVQGSGFLNTPSLTCRFNNTNMTALYMGASEILCSFPIFALGSQQQANLYLQVSNDRVTWSNPAPITYYNSNCVLCTQANQCSPNPSSCNIGGACYANGDINLNNPCQVCDSTRNSTSWTYTYASTACWPQFDFPVYSFKVVGTVPANTQLGTIRAINSYLTADRTYSLSYSLNSTFANIPFSVMPDPSTRNNAIVYTNAAINVAALDPTRLPGFFTLTATDSQGHFATSNGLVNFIAQDTAPVFGKPTYTGSISENATVGAVVLTVQANATITGGVTYDWVISDTNGNHFGLNPNTGVITLLAPLDYSDTSSYFLQVKATDKSGQYQVVDVRINVTYVPKPPTDIVLTSNSVDEKSPVGTVVTSLTPVDPGSSSWNFTLNNRGVPFYLNGSNVIVNTTFDYEVGPHTYTLNITVRDETGLTLTKLVNITINNIIEPPTNVKVCPTSGCNTPFAVPDDTRVGQVIGTINFSNPDGAQVTCTVFPNTTYGVVNNNGVWQVTLLQPLDYVTAQQSFIFPVCTVVNTHQQVVGSSPTMTTVTVVNTPHPPQPPVLVLNPVLTGSGGITENTTASGSSGSGSGSSGSGSSGSGSSGSGVVVGTVTSTNPNPLATNMSFTITGPANATFSLGNPTCSNATGIMSCSVNLTLTGSVTGVVYNASGYGYIPVTVHVTDLGSGKSTDTIIYVPVQFVNTAPNTPSWVGGATVQEQSPVGTEVGIIELQNPYPFAPEQAQIIDNSQVTIVPLVLTRRDATAKPRYSVRINNPSISYMNTQSISFSINVSNTPPSNLAAPMWAIRTMSFAVAHKPMTPSLMVGNTRLSTNATVDVNERTPGFTAIGSLVIDNMDRADLDVAYTLLNDGQGYFVLSGSTLETSAQFLEFATVQFLDIAVQATFTAKADATNVVAFVPTSVSYFRVAVQPVTAAPTLIFTENNKGSYNTSVVVDNLPNVLTVAHFQVSGRRNSALRPTLSADPLHLFDVSYSPTSDSFEIKLVQTPAQVTSNTGFYSNVVVNVPDVSGTISGLLNVTLLPTVPVLTPGGFPGLSEESKSSSLGSTTLAGVVVGAVVGLIVLVLLIALVVVRRRKQALDTKIANEPFYSQVNSSSGLNNPTYLDQVMVSSSLGFEPGIQNPMYAWYRPDLNRQESEEFLADQVEGAFVIRDSAATPGWHMLAVKTHNAIVHEKIKMTDDGLYELLPNSALNQPKFKEMPLLVEHYAEQQAGIRYSLALDNPLYDNSHMAHKKHGHSVAGAWSYQADSSAPSLPLKERELAAVQQLAEAAEGEEIYTNQEQAKNVISSA